MQILEKRFKTLARFFQASKTTVMFPVKLQPHWSKDGNTGEQQPCQELHMKDSKIPWVKNCRADQCVNI